MTNNHRLIIEEGDYDKLIYHITTCPDERMAFMYCGRTSARDRTDWLVRFVDLPRDDDYRHQGVARVSLKSEAVVGRVLRARTASGFVDVHSHPCSSWPGPSSTDEQGARVQLRMLRDLAPGTTLLRLIIGGAGEMFAEVHDETRGWTSLSSVHVLGPSHGYAVPLINAPTPTGDPEAMDKRSLAVVGPALDKLRQKRVLVIGVGGVGSAVAGQLAGLVGHVDLVDPDHVEGHNLPRLHGVEAIDVGQPKVEAITRGLRNRFARLEVAAHVGRFPDERSEQMFRAADFVFCCPDHHAVRWAASSLAARTLRPLIEVGCGGRRAAGAAITDLGYHVRLQAPGGPCLACNGLDLSRLEDPASTTVKTTAGYIDGDGVVQGELVTLTTRAAAEAVDVFLRYVTRYLGGAPGHLYYDAVHFRSMNMTAAYSSDPLCSLCGDKNNALRASGDALNKDQQVLKSPREVRDAVV